ncbi:protein kinase [Lachnospiraceae bacterium 46-15]
MEFNRCIGCMEEHTGEGECPHCGFDARKYEEAFHHLLPGTVLNGKYVLGKVLGEGGFGISYLGWDLNLECKVAIKEYYPASYVTRQAVYTPIVSVLNGSRREFYQKGLNKFVEEAKSLAKFSRLPGIVFVRDYFQENGTAYIVMEFAEGMTLKSLLEKNDGRLPAELVFRMMRPVMESLKEVHKKGLIHRDISPDNMMVDEKGQVKLLDFGAARNYLSGEEKSLSVILKPGYTPEEQYRSRGEQGPWTDVYALCATMYRAITGELPLESLDRMSEDDLKPPLALGVSISPQQEAALMRGLAVYKKDRLADMEELMSALYQEKVNLGAAAPPHRTFAENLQAEPLTSEPQKKKGILKWDGRAAAEKGKKMRWMKLGAAAAALIVILYFIGSGGEKEHKPVSRPKQGWDETEQRIAQEESWGTEMAQDTSENGTEADAEAARLSAEAKEVLESDEFKGKTKAHWEMRMDKYGHSRLEGFFNGEGNMIGEGKQTYVEGTLEGRQYEGYFSDGKYVYGKCTYGDGGWFKGNEQSDVQKFGIRHFASTNQTYKGEYEDVITDGLVAVYNEVSGKVVKVLEKGKDLSPFPLKEGNGSIYTSAKSSGKSVIIYDNNLVYVGEVSNQQPHGWGAQFYENGDHYEGEFSNGKQHGPGIYYFENGARQIVNCADGAVNGPCVQIATDGGRLEYLCQEGMCVGRWINIGGDGTVTTGVWEDGELVKDADTEYWLGEDGESVYAGRRKNGETEGQIAVIYKSGEHYIVNAHNNSFVCFYPFYDGTSGIYFAMGTMGTGENAKIQDGYMFSMQLDGRVRMEKLTD